MLDFALGVQNSEKIILGDEIPWQKSWRILVYHQASRWYVGEMMCHAQWLNAFAKAGLPVTWATHRNYLEIFANDPNITRLIPAQEITEDILKEFDVVVFPSIRPSPKYYPYIRHALYSSRDGLVYVHNGKVKQYIAKLGINYFQVSAPRFIQTGLPDSDYYQIKFTAEEKDKASRTLSQLFGKEVDEVIIVNPTSSNPFTRESDRKKAVDNELDKNDYVLLIEKILADFPKSKVLVGAAVKENDANNYHLIEEIGKCFQSKSKVRTLSEVKEIAEGVSFREFAALLSEPRVITMVGNSTGTNAHLAASVNVPAFSIERAADATMRANWRDPDAFQMGAFRWRNPNPTIAGYGFNWNESSYMRVEKLACFLHYHNYWVKGKWESLFGNQVSKAKDIAIAILAAIQQWITANHPEPARLRQLLLEFVRLFTEPKMVAFFFNFTDEVAYLIETEQGDEDNFIFFLARVNKDYTNLPTMANVSQQEIVCQLFANSNLHKLLIRLK